MARAKFFKTSGKMPEAPINVYHSVWFPFEEGTKQTVEAYINIEYMDRTISLTKRDTEELLIALTSALNTMDANIEEERVKNAARLVKYEARKAKKEVTV